MDLLPYSSICITLNVFQLTIFLRFDTAVSNLDRTGFDAIITRTDTNDPTDGWGQNPTLHFIIYKPFTDFQMEGYFTF